MHSSRISAVDSHQYKCNEAGGEQSLEHTLKDHYIYVSNLKMKEIESSDNQIVIGLLNQLVTKKSDFLLELGWMG